MKDNILIIGGYGKVGRIISKHLTAAFAHKVVIAGRNFQKADALASELDHKAIAYSLDISNCTDIALLDKTKLVIMCIDQKDTAFAKLCIQKQVLYLDITANDLFIEQMALLDQEAIDN
ncbi:saccharopine dehydrogenase NADP-binding domain-containing protein [Myroides pelagicus]|uniref:saccharopine dehydrogenase NADP-binding domain-containing protein n=1 Tax=Myroides pelagicus TaxID=270914 RepID=UPI002DBFC663|nr:saccharopine dehydrogenase NADP-binding domain-containing protein [Myroides pelagicus]MEC4115173.1 saccharopine dehydrogenase NADP-binding domain-containing protein [Myroides pelagicus]